MARTGSRPLVVTADAALLDDLLRLAATAGTELEVATDPAAARPHYERAPVVLVGPDQTAPLVRARLRRRAVVLVGHTGAADPPPGLIARLGIAHIATLPAAEDWLVAQLGTPPPAPPGRVIALLGGRGGAGVSTFAVTLAVTAAHTGRRVLLLDADPLGGRLDLMVGVKQFARPGPGALTMLNLDTIEADGVPGQAVAGTLDTGRGRHDLIVVDVARHLDRAGQAVLQAADQAYLVVPAELRASLSAGRVAALARPHSRHLAMIVRDASADTLPVDDVARTVRLTVAGTYRSDPALRTILARGEVPSAGGPGPLVDLCRRLLTASPGRDTGEAAA
ncbi:P-loop NTPase [Catenuloplanes japonicus]|uniref:P-loop NTPase n=1 Tax=Catenuloplanes japonicus TaxID=33876 RepID=UPI000526A041|nr:P-loop NTPase [Catenuloplanes japonicus]